MSGDRIEDVHCCFDHNMVDLLSRIEELGNRVMCEMQGLLDWGDIEKLAREYHVCLQKRNVDIGFNLFALISDVYYRENLHSDILRAILDPHGKHGCDNRFLILFLDLLRLHNVHVVDADFANADVVREEGRIDILIRDSISRKAIIIENKINGAGDMDRQLARYLEVITERGYTCASIVYLCLNREKFPETPGWETEERDRVNKLLTVVCAYNETQKDLYNGWLRRSLEAAKNVAMSSHESDDVQDTVYILRQYSELITKLGGNVMNKPIMEEFYKVIIQGNRLKTALSLKQMLDDLADYRTERIVDAFRNDAAPFGRVTVYTNHPDAVFMELYYCGAHFGIDVWSDVDRYRLWFWDRGDEPCVNGRAQRMLERIGLINEFKQPGGECGKRFAREFDFPSQENDLYEFLKTFKHSLSLEVKAD